MATTISSGRGNSPLLTANIADHGTIYGATWIGGVPVPLVFGCTDSSYIEYDTNANTDTGFCNTPIILGCMNSNYLEYDLNANIDTGFCLNLKFYGCMNPDYLEYNASAKTKISFFSIPT